MGASIRAAALSFVLATLGACGGGGGGGGGVITPSPSTSEVALASFPAVTPNQTVIMEGTSVTMTGTVAPSGSVPVMTIGASPIENATVKFSYDSDRALSAITVATPQTSFSFDRKAGDTVTCKGDGICMAKNPATTGFAVDPFVVGWNYQSFGVWGNADLGAATWKIGVVSAGSPTSGSALPTTGSATFTGLTGALFADTAGDVRATVARMSADVNFGSRSIQFSTSGTKIGNSLTPEPGLDLKGNLSYAPGVNAFSGSMQTNNGQLSGQGAGRFYGPAAEEIGGVYSLQGSGLSRLVGAFGGKR